MKHRLDENLRRDIDRFALRHTCEDCAHFATERGTCGHGYPTADHRKNTDATELVFCKEFELS